MSRRILYLLNPVSGTRQKSPLIQQIASYTTKKKIPFEILPTNAEGDYIAVRKKILAEKITDVVVCGGDGSVNQAVYPLADTGVQFGIVPLGSGNGLALAAKIPRSTAKALDVIFAGKSSLVDGFMVNDRFACMLCGLGFDAAIAHEFAGYGSRGFTAYAKLTAKKFFSARPYKFSVKVSGREFNTEAFFISVANSNQFGNHFTIAPAASLSDGLLDVVIVKKTFKPVLLWNVLQQVLAGKIKKVEQSLDEPVIYFQTKTLSITNGARAPMHIDGEPKNSEKEIRIKVLPKFFNLIQPS